MNFNYQKLLLTEILPMVRRFNSFVVVITFLFFYSLAQAQKGVEVIHWWISGGEREALQAVIDAYEAQGNTWMDTPVEASYYAKSAAVSRILIGRPPAAVQWHAGVSLKEMYTEGLFRNVTKLAEEQGWQDVLPKAIWDNITVDGKVIAVPMALHGSNWIWANKKILDDVGIGIPRSWEEFLGNADRIIKAGYYPLALGGQPWQMRALFFSVVLDIGGPDLYEAAFVQHKPEALLSPAMINAFKTFGRLRQYVDPDSPGRNWLATTELVIKGKAAFQIMGDWAKAEFFQAGMVADKDFICSLSPGSGDTYIVVSDVFAMGNVTDETVRDSQLRLAGTMMDKEVQKKFNLLKGAISPRTDVSKDGFDICAQLAMTTVERGRTLPGFDMANSDIVASGTMSVISRYWDDLSLSPEKAAQMIVQAVSVAKL